jgi:hypothetical protein
VSSGAKALNEPRAKIALRITDLTLAERRLFAPSAPPARHVETISNAAKIS